MTTTVDANNSAGFKVTADTSGILQLQTNSIAALTVDASQNVGIGTASPNSRMSVAVSSTSTSVLGTYANIPLLLQNTSSTDNNWSVIAVQDASGDFSSYIGTQNTSQSSNTAIMTFGTNSGIGATERMRIDSSGNVGIGVTPSYRLEVKGPSATAGQLSIHDGTGDTTVSGNNAASLLFQARDTSVRTIAEIDAVNTTTNGTGGAMVFQTRISDTLAERMRINGGAPILCLQGGNTSATGTGIAFPATQSASSDANTLDDYEEGTWSAVVAGEAGTITSYTVNSATYTKIGDTVYVYLRFTVSNKGTGSNFVVSGLPFAASRELLGIWAETNTTGLTGFMFTAGTGATSFTSRLAANWGGACLVNGSYTVEVTYKV